MLGKESTGRVVGDLQLQSLSDQGLHDETGRKCALCASNSSNTLAAQAAVATSNNTLALALADGNPEFMYSSHLSTKPTPLSMYAEKARKMRVQQSKNGLFFRPECTSYCITKNDSANHPCSKKHTKVIHAPLNSAGQYVLFPAMTFHQGYFINQEETVYTAQFFAAFKPNWKYSSRTKWNKCPLFYKVQGISPNKLCALKEDLYANWDDHYPSATYPPPKHYKNEKIDTESNRYVLQEHFSHPQLHHVMALVAIFEYLYPLEIKSVWFIKKSRGGDGFQRWHQDLVEVGISAATIVLNIDSLGHEEEENDLSAS